MKTILQLLKCNLLIHLLSNFITTLINKDAFNFHIYFFTGQKFAMKSATCILASVLRRFKLKALHKPEEMKFYGEIVLKPQQGIHIALEER